MSVNDKPKSIKVNFIYNSVLTLSSIIFPIITFPYISRVLGPAGTGNYNFATSIVNYFSMFAMLGIPTYGIRACAKTRDDEEKLSITVSEIFVINLLITGITYVLFFVTLFSVEKLEENKLLLMVIGFSMLFNLIGMEWLFKGLELYSYITIRSLIFKIISVILMFLFVKSETDTVKYAAIFVFSTAGSYILNFKRAHKYINYRWHGLNLKKHFKPILIFFAMSVATIVYTNLDNVMLGFMKTDTDVGYYSAAVKIKYILASLVSSLGAVLLPRASNYIEKNLKDKFRYISSKAFNFVFLFAIPLSVYFIIYAEEGILLLAGTEYLQAVPAMKIIMPTVLLIGLTNIMGIQMLVPLGKEKQVLYSEVIGAIVDLLLNLILIPFYGAAGAAIGTLVAEASVLIAQVIALKQELISCLKGIQIFRILLATTCATVVACLISLTLQCGVFWILCITACVFFGIYVVMLFVLKEKLFMSIVNELIKKVKKSV